jgi:DNA modification methylase
MGLESDLNHHVGNIRDVCANVKGVLKKMGSLFLNVGDTYGTHSGVKQPRAALFRTANIAEKIGLNMKKRFEKPSDNFVLEKNLFLVPSRIAIALQDDGWILRNDIIWQKTSVLPTGAKDRLTNTYEHIFWFVKSTKYYCNLQPALDVDENPINAEKKRTFGDVWRINAKPHGRNVGGYPEAICTLPIRMCCPENGIVLDPMCGTGTTCITAKSLRRKFIGIDIISENILMARDRLLEVCPKCGANTFVAKDLGKVICLSCDYEDTIVKQ